MTWTTLTTGNTIKLEYRDDGTRTVTITRGTDTYSSTDADIIDGTRSATQALGSNVTVTVEADLDSDEGSINGIRYEVTV